MDDATLKKQLSDAIEAFRKKIASFRLGRATPALVEDIPVDAYGSTMPIKHCATIQAPDSKLLVIQPFDQNLSKAIETAIQQSDLGIQPVNEGKILRIVIPPMTEERRQQMVKLIHETIEEGRIRVRKVREEAMNGLRSKERDGTISEDERVRTEKEIQQSIDETIASIDGIGSAKEDELGHV